MDVRILSYELTTAAGVNVEALRASIDAHQSGLCKNDLLGSAIDTWIGKVDGLDAPQLGPWQSRNNALAALGLAQGDLESRIADLRERFGPHRLGGAIGSSTSSIDRTETAYQHLAENGIGADYQQPLVHHPGCPAMFVAQHTGLTGPAITINTACSSSAKAFSTGARWLEAGLVDAVVVGGVDTLCLTVVHGFHSLQLVSENQCKPLDKDRDGINLGEAAGYAILMRAEDVGRDGVGVSLRGYGESSDAHHMSHPHPEGRGARDAMLRALHSAGVNADKVDYINLHGTSSRANDRIEGLLVSDLLPRARASSTKAWTGHTLGAAGITEALISVAALRRDLAPGTLNLEQLEEGIELNTSASNQAMPLQFAMSNSFGFGGINCSLLFEKLA